MRMDMIEPPNPLPAMGDPAGCPGCASADNALADGGLVSPGSMMPLDTRTLIMGAALFYLIWYAMTKR